jgi:putative transposase
MKRSKFTDEQILAIVKEGEAGRKVADLCRANGITEQTYYRWKAKYGGMELSEMQRLKELEDENWSPSVLQLVHISRRISRTRRPLKFRYLVPPMRFWTEAKNSQSSIEVVWGGMRSNPVVPRTRIRMVWVSLEATLVNTTSASVAPPTQSHSPISRHPECSWMMT